VFEIPQDVVKTKGFVPVTVICDQIRDPGNLGSIIRNAAGAGVERIILTPGKKIL
jgi:tRNA G18 (ribose-2'-O)-methylase SpoU